MKRLLTLFWIVFTIYLNPSAIHAQESDTVTVNLRMFNLPKLPLPGQAFQASRFSFKMPDGSTGDTVLHFSHVVIGKWEPVQMWIAVKGNRILKTGIFASGPAMVKRIRKELPKNHGPAFSLERYAETDILNWRKSANQPYLITLCIQRDLSSCRFWITR